MRDFTLHPFREVVMSVGSLDVAEVYQKVGGYEVLYGGRATDAPARAWHLPNAETGEILLGQPGDELGFLRLVRLEGVAAQPIRPAAQIWDTGGIFDINIRVHDIEQKYAELVASGWHGVTEPVAYTFGGLQVKEVLLRGHDDVVVALIERVAPPLEGWDFGAFSRVFNSTQIVPDVDAAVAFYTDMLGFNLVYRGEIGLSEDEPNVLGIPRNLVKPAPNVAIVSPTDTTGGSVEFIALPHLKGGDYTRYAQPPNRGILTLRFPVTDLAAYHEHLKEKGVDVVTEPVTLRLEPYGEVSLMAVQTPNGVWLEFFEALHPEVP